LFVALGVKGSEKTLSALANTRLSISSIASTSLEAKAAILGMAYALERLTTGAANEGSDLKRFSAYINANAEDVEKWDYAARKARISVQSMRGSILGIKKVIEENIAHPGSLPAGANRFAQETLFDFTKPWNFDQFLRKAVEFTKSKRISRDEQNLILKQFGLSPDLIGSIESGQFKLSNVDHAPILSNKEVDSLANISSQFTDIEEKVRLFFGHFTAKHGKEIVDIIKDITTAFLGLATVIDNLMTKFKFFETLDNALKDLKATLGDFSSEKDANKLRQQREQEIRDNKQLYEQYQRILEVDKKFNKNMNSSGNYGNTDQESLKKIGDFYSIIQQGAHSGLENFVRGGLDLIFGNQNKGQWQDQLKNIFDYKNITPQMPFMNSNPQNNNINVTQNISFDGNGDNLADIQNMQMTALQKGIVDTMSIFNRGRQT